MTKNEFSSKWLSCFAKDISRKDIEKYVISAGSYLWHVFSWGLIDEKLFLKGDDARKAYDKIDKHNALYINWFEDDETNNYTVALNTADTVDKTMELYVVASDFSWTYMKTHECMCGPYFMKL